eukprot:2715702-Amphidinium_carterae.1
MEVHDIYYQRFPPLISKELTADAQAQLSLADSHVDAGTPMACLSTVSEVSAHMQQVETLSEAIAGALDEVATPSKGEERVDGDDASSQPGIAPCHAPRSTVKLPGVKRVDSRWCNLPVI